MRSGAVFLRFATFDRSGDPPTRITHAYNSTYSHCDGYARRDSDGDPDSDAIANAHNDSHGDTDADSHAAFDACPARSYHPAGAAAFV